MVDWKGVSGAIDKGKGKVDWKGAKCDPVGKKDKSDLTPGMGAVKSVDRFKSSKMGKS